MSMAIKGYTQKKRYYGWWIVVAGFLMMAICHSAVYSCASLFIKPVCTDLGFSRSAFSGYITIAAIFSIFTSATTGRLLSQKNIRIVMLICVGLFTLSFLGFAFSVSLWQFYVFGVIQMIAYGGLGVLPYSVLINNWFGPRKKGLAMSLCFAGSGIGGMILSPVITGIILDAGWRSAYGVIAFLGLVVSVPIILLLVVKSPSEKGLDRLGDDPDPSASLGQNGLTLKEVRKTPVFWTMMAALFLNNLAGCSALSQGASYFSDIGYGAMGAARLVSISLGCLTLGKVVLGTLHDKLGTPKAVSICTVLMITQFVSLYFAARSSIFLIPYVISFALAMAVGTVSTPLIAAHLFGDRDFGAIVGLLNVASGLGNAAGPFLAAKIYDINQSYSLAWIIMTGVAALSLVCFMIGFTMGKKNRQQKMAHCSAVSSK